MNNKDALILKKMQRHTQAILDYCADCQTLEQFEENTMRVEATVFNLMQLGELAKSSLSEEVKTQLPSIPWKQIYGLRNRIVHGYDGVNMKIVWDTVAEDIPVLNHQLLHAVSKCS